MTYWKIYRTHSASSQMLHVFIDDHKYSESPKDQCQQVEHDSSLLEFEANLLSFVNFIRLAIEAINGCVTYPGKCLNSLQSNSKIDQACN